MKLVRLCSQKNHQILEGHTDEVTSVDIDKSENYIISGCVDKSIILLDRNSGKQIK